MNTIPAKTIISKKSDTSWFGTEYNMNLYKGCCHGCIYCDSRSDCYQIQDFDMVRAKENAIKIIHEELSRKVKTGVIGTGAMSDPYNPFEEKMQLTRQALELIDYYKFGIGIATKSNLIVRDVDLLRRIKEHSPVICKVTVTSLDDELSRKIEPSVCPGTKRMEAVKQLSDAGIYTGILMMPLLPHLTDTPENVHSIIQAAQQNGARFIFPLFGLSIRNGQREYLYRKLDELFPGQDLSKTYRKLYGSSYWCHSPREAQLKQLFIKECEQLHILYQMEDIIKGYKKGYDFEQLSLFM